MEYNKFMDLSFVKWLEGFKLLANSKARYTESELADAPTRNYRINNIPDDSGWRIVEIKESAEPAPEGYYPYEVKVAPLPIQYPLPNQ